MSHADAQVVEGDLIHHASISVVSAKINFYPAERRDLIKVFSGVIGAVVGIAASLLVSMPLVGVVSVIIDIPIVKTNLGIEKNVQDIISFLILGALACIGSYVGWAVAGSSESSTSSSISNYGHHSGTDFGCIIYSDSGVPGVGYGTYVGSVEDGIVYRDSGSPGIGYGDYRGSIIDRLVYRDNGNPGRGYGTYIGSVTRDGLIYQDSGSPGVGYGLYVGSVQEDKIYRDSGIPGVGYGDYVGSGVGGSREEIGAAALLLGLV